MRHLTLAATAFISTSSAAFSEELTTTDVFTHPSQGDVAIVEDATSHLMSSPGGAFVHFESGSLKPGHAHTMWFVTIANPAACAASPCSGADVLMNTDEVVADVNYASGAMADETGFASFSTYRDIGALRNGWFGHGFTGAANSEIHLVIMDHGSPIAGETSDMLSTFRGGCTDESISKAFPPIAMADGASGPNTCAMVQFSVFTKSQQQN